MNDVHKVYRLPNNTVATLEMKSVAKLLKSTGMDETGDLQTFHTNNVLRRIVKYWARRSGMTIKVMIAQTDIKVPSIILDVPYGQILFTGKRKGKAIRYSKAKHPLAGPRPDLALEAAEGAAMAADLERELKWRRGL